MQAELALQPLTAADRTIQDLRITSTGKTTRTHKKEATPKPKSQEAAAKASELPESEGKQLFTEESSELQVITKLEAPSNEQRGKATEGSSSLGGYAYLPVDEGLRDEVEYKCSLCALIPRDPAKVDCCGFIFCRSCIEAHSQNNSLCPACNESFDKIPDNLLKRKINILEVYCVNREKGCEWSGELCRMAEHTGTEEREDTGTERCQYEHTTCKKCDQEVLYGELDNHLTSHCQHRAIPCTFKYVGCNFEGSEASMSKHLQDNATRHLTLLGESVRDRQHNRPPRHNYCCKVLLIIAALACVAYIFLGPSVDTEQLVQHICKTTITDELTTHAEGMNDRMDGLNRKTVANELAIQSLEYGLSKDIHTRLQELEDSVRELKIDVQRLSIDADYLKDRIDELKMDIADLKSGFTKRIDDAIKAAMNYFFPELIIRYMSQEKDAIQR